MGGRGGVNVKYFEWACGQRHDTWKVHQKKILPCSLQGRLAAPRFRHRPETSHLDCGRLLSGDVVYMAGIAASRVTMIERRDLEMNCEAIRSRILPPTRSMATNFGVAFARIVHTVTTMWLILDYRPSLCYSGLWILGRTTISYIFHWKSLLLPRRYEITGRFQETNVYAIKVPAKCLFNTRLSVWKLWLYCYSFWSCYLEQLEIDGAIGTNVNFAHMACLKLLENKGSWSYVILQQVCAFPAPLTSTRISCCLVVINLDMDFASKFDFINNITMTAVD